MRGRTIAAIGVTGALAVGGSAVAMPGGPIGLLGGPDERQEELAGDLADKLGGGVTQGEVDKALGEIREERQAEHRKEHAAALAAELDGVSTAEVERALEKTEAAARRSFEKRERPSDPAAALARELGKTKAEIRKAMRAAGRKQMDARLDEAVKAGRITEKQADRIRKRMADGPRFDRLRRGGPGPRMRMHGGPPPPGGGLGGPGGGPPPFGP